jgi:Fe-S-cluster containining protein
VPGGERRAVREILARGQTEARLLEVAEGAITRGEALEASQGKELPAVACRAGCSWCCTFPVDVTVPEALVLARHIRLTWTEAAIESLRARLTARREETRGETKAARPGRRLPCTLLGEGGKCSVYAARPLACRAWTSFDAQACEDGVTRPELPIPTDEMRLLIHNGVQDGLWMGLRDAGHRIEILDLAAALLIVLTESDAAERWGRGNAVFAGAST